MSVETLDAIVGAYGSSTKSKLANPAATGQPEDQIRTPFSQLLADLAVIVGFAGGSVVAVGETSLGDLKVRPDYAVTVQNALVGHVELKAPGKGADPNKFKDPHDKAQWKRLRSLPNLMYCDGNEFSLWHYGKAASKPVRLLGDVETSGSKLQAPPTLLALFSTFLSWEPMARRRMARRRPSHSTEECS